MPVSTRANGIDSPSTIVEHEFVIHTKPILKVSIILQLDEVNIYNLGMNFSLIVLKNQLHVHLKHQSMLSLASSPFRHSQLLVYSFHLINALMALHVSRKWSYYACGD